MNKIYQLLDKEFVLSFFQQHILPEYPDFTEIKKIEIKPHKKLIWDFTYHVVIEYVSTFAKANGQEETFCIFCSAHSNEPRKNVFDALKFLWSHNFADNILTIPHPLYYSSDFCATFYQGIMGENLYQFIKDHNYKEIEDVVVKAAAWFAKLHRLPADFSIELNKSNSHIATIIPGSQHVLEKIKEKYPQFYPISKNIYQELIRREDKFLNQNPERWFVHGDAHPENIIKMNKEVIGVIDFTDFCLSDFARDVGGFLQQVEYMCARKIDDPEFIKRIKEIFLEKYLNNAKVELDESLKERIETYYNWTAFRTAIFFLTSYLSKAEKAEPLLKKIANNLNIAYAH